METKSISYFTYANCQTKEGKERIFFLIKIFYEHLTRTETFILNLNLPFYEDLIREKPDSRYIVFFVNKKQYGFGIFSREEVKKGKIISKEQGFIHEYVSSAKLAISIREFFKTQSSS